jgi:PadR family transcriptional regulator PadR
MARTISLGEFEQLVLLAILRLDERAYGVSIRAEIAKRTGRKVAPGALYTTLDRLQARQMVFSRLGEATAERGGRAKRFYRVSAEGVRAVTRAQRDFQSLLQGLPLLEGSHA